MNTYLFTRKNENEAFSSGNMSFKLNTIKEKVTIETKPQSNWFAYIESKDRVWIYNGNDALTLHKWDKEGAGTYSTKICGVWLDNEIPKLVRELADGLVVLEN